MINIERNPVEANNHFKKCKQLIQLRSKSILKNGFRKNKVKIDSSSISPDAKAFINLLLDDSYLNNLITISPENIQSLISAIKANNRNLLISSHNDSKAIYNIFIDNAYENPKFSKTEFIKGLSIDTCPYCNRGYIYYLSKSSDIKPQLDHFYPKSIYPFLGMSYYNLIPSCQTCNGFGAKEEKDPLAYDLINPYLIEEHNFKFNYKIKSINFINPLHDKYSVDIFFEHCIQGHVDVFKLDKLYNQHSDHVIELIIKSQIQYSSKYRQYLESYNNFSFSPSEIDRMIIGNYVENNELHKRPLAKLYQNIGKALGIIL